MVSLNVVKFATRSLTSNASQYKVRRLIGVFAKSTKCRGGGFHIHIVKKPFFK